MFRNKKDKDLDYTSLNEILKVGSKLADIFYVISIIAIILLGTYLLKEWKILNFIGEFLAVISPIFIGFIIAWLFDPLVEWLQSKKIPRIIGCIIVYLLIFGGLFLLLYLIVPTFIDQIKDFVGTVPDLIKDFKDIVDAFFKSLSIKSGVNALTIKNEIYLAIEKFSLTLTTSIPNALLNAGQSLIGGIISFALGLMIGFYMLYDFNKLNAHIESVLPKKWRKTYKELGERLNSSLRNYIQGLLLVMLLVFITQAIGLTLAGLKAPLILTGICSIVAILVVQLLENNFYQPLIMGHTMKLHPVTIMLGLLIFQHFFGIIGMIVATPMIAAGKVIFTYIDEKLNIIDKITGDNKN